MNKRHFTEEQTNQLKDIVHISEKVITNSEDFKEMALKRMKLD